MACTCQSFPEWHVLVKAGTIPPTLAETAVIIDLRSFYNYAKNWQINTKFLLITKLFLSMTLFLFVLIYNSVKGIARGGWSGFGMVSNGSDPTSFGLYPTGIPPRVIVQICRDGGWQVASVNLMCIRGQYHSPASKRCRQPEHIFAGYFMERVYVSVLI